MQLQILGCARCSTAFTFSGIRVEQAADGKLANQSAIDCCCPTEFGIISEIRLPWHYAG
jgi:hypothetical protein